MDILGIDTSSLSCGHCMVSDGEYQSHAVWQPTSIQKKVGGNVRMWAYYLWLNTYVGMRKAHIDLVAIEALAVARNAKVTRTLAHYENVATIVCLRHALPIVSIRAGVARNLVLGVNPNISKEAMFIELQRQYPDIVWPEAKQGGLDVADAFVQAKAAPLV